jgi:HSP20 family protein
MERLQRDNHAINPYSKQYFDKASNRYVIKIKTSGIGENNFNISTDKNNLIIKAKQNSKSNNRSSSSYFSQVVSLPKDGDVENIMTEFKEGVLKISIPKLDKPRA